MRKGKIRKNDEIKNVNYKKASHIIKKKNKKKMTENLIFILY